MAYSNLDSDLKKYGFNANRNMPDPLFTPEILSFYRDQIEDEINSRLSRSGVGLLPIAEANYPNAFRRLKHLSALGITAQMEEVRETRGSGTETKQEMHSARLWKRFKDRLSEYCEDPVLSLYQGDSNISSAVNDYRYIQPVGTGLTSYIEDDDQDNFECEFKVDDIY